MRVLPEAIQAGKALAAALFRAMPQDDIRTHGHGALTRTGPSTAVSQTAKTETGDDTMSKRTLTQAARAEPLSGSEREYIEKLVRESGGRRAHRPKRCFRNAQRLMLYDHENQLQYWESGLPVPHAWVTINGKIVDVTYDAVDRILPRKLKRMGYSRAAAAELWVKANIKRDRQYRSGVRINWSVTAMLNLHRTGGAPLLRESRTWWKRATQQWRDEHSRDAT